MEEKTDNLEQQVNLLQEYLERTEALEKQVKELMDVIEEFISEVWDLFREVLPSLTVRFWVLARGAFLGKPAKEPVSRVWFF